MKTSTDIQYFANWHPKDPTNTTIAYALVRTAAFSHWLNPCSGPRDDAHWTLPQPSEYCKMKLLHSCRCWSWEEKGRGSRGGEEGWVGSRPVPLWQTTRQSGPKQLLASQHQTWLWVPSSESPHICLGPQHCHLHASSFGRLQLSSEIGPNFPAPWDGPPRWPNG